MSLQVRTYSSKNRWGLQTFDDIEKENKNRKHVIPVCFNRKSVIIICKWKQISLVPGNRNIFCETSLQYGDLCTPGNFKVTEMFFFICIAILIHTKQRLWHVDITNGLRVLDKNVNQKLMKITTIMCLWRNKKKML